MKIQEVRADSRGRTTDGGVRSIRQVVRCQAAMDEQQFLAAVEVDQEFRSATGMYLRLDKAAANLRRAGTNPVGLPARGLGTGVRP
jgi:hypothetical protein